MTCTAATPRANPHALLGLFPSADDLTRCEVVPADDMPQPYRGLLVHRRHMTATLEGHHGGRLDVRILEHRGSAAWYARKILLALQRSGRVVEYSIVRVR